MFDHRRMTDAERERDLRRRNINPHAPCAPGFTVEEFGQVILDAWASDGEDGYMHWVVDVLGYDSSCGDWGALLGPALCSKDSIHMPDCDTGEEMSFAEWLRRQGLLVDRKAGVLRLSGVMEVAS